jgi:glycosyltransferase involved in cell wall biosynthesis
VNVTSATGEGFGLNLVESSACGTTTIAPRNSAIPEILLDTGHVVDNCGIFTQGLDNGHMRPVVSIPRMVDAMEIEYQKWLDNGKKKVINQRAIDNVRTRFNWEDKRDQLLSCFREILNPSV